MPDHDHDPGPLPDEPVEPTPAQRDLAERYRRLGTRLTTAFASLGPWAISQGQQRIADGKAPRGMVGEPDADGVSFTWAGLLVLRMSWAQLVDLNGPDVDA